jgi:uncharacterized repeat protein (TIGR03803 family)
MKSATSSYEVINPFLLALMVAGLGSVLAGRVTGQTFTVLHSFAGSDGASPYSGLVLVGGTLYGTAAYAGSSNNGTVFKLNTDGTGFTNLHSFAGGPTDGGRPNEPLLISGNVLYGTAFRGGGSGVGTVFAINTDGTGFTNLHSFTGGAGGDGPDGALVLSANTLYGITVYGGDSGNGTSLGNGTVFAVNTDGTAFRIVYSFTATDDPYYTNADGAGPSAGLILSEGTLYGIAYRGGLSARGTVFALSTNGTPFTTVYSFGGGSDGANPDASLILSGETLYGMTQYGGDSGDGKVFAINTNGTGFRTVYSFTGTSGSASTNSDGAGPVGGVVLSGHALYGMAVGGGNWAGGTVFKVNADGSGFVTLHNFMLSNGAYPFGGLICSNNSFYGTTQSGGASGKGTVFSLFILPQLTIAPVGVSVILTWPTNYDGFTLQSTTNLISPVWTSNLPLPVLVDGQNTVTSAISGKSQFYRLIR